jgi:hypothetical protein
MEGRMDIKRVLAVAKDKVLEELELHWRCIVDALQF